MPTYSFESRITGDHEPEPTTAEMEVRDRDHAIGEARRSLVGLCDDMLRKGGKGVDLTVRDGGVVLYEVRLTIAERVRG